jgi:hypothetical protein
MSVAAKTYNRALVNRRWEPLDSILIVNQGRFRKRRSCIEQIHAVRRPLNSATDKQRYIFVIFVGFKKTFDSINRTTLFDALRLYWMHIIMAKAIEAIYHHSRSAVLVNEKGEHGFSDNIALLKNSLDRSD